MAISQSVTINPSATKKRSVEIDILRGVTILWVVMLHLSISPTCLDSVSRMGILFLISGMFFKPLDLKPFVKKKVTSLLIPLLYFWLISWAIEVMEYDVPEMLASHSFDWSIFDFIGRYSYMNVNVLWFLSVLFVTNVLFCILWNYLKRYSFRTYVIAFISVIMYLCGAFLVANKIQFKYFSLPDMLIYQIYFVIGVYSSSFWKNVPSIIISLPLALLFVFIFEMLPVPFLVKTIPFTLVITAFLLAFLRILANSPITKSFAFFGVNSIVVYLTHMLIIYSPFGKNMIGSFDGDTGRWLLFLIICIAEVPLILFFNKYMPFAIGKKKKKAI